MTPLVTQEPDQSPKHHKPCIFRLKNQSKFVISSTSQMWKSCKTIDTFTKHDKMSNWYINNGGKIYGPMDNETLKQLANRGKIKPDTPIRQGSEGTWSKCGKVKGLFTAISTSKATTIVEVPPDIERAVTKQNTQIVSEKTCMYCGELISLIAVKCKHCKEYLDPNLRTARTVTPQVVIPEVPQQQQPSQPQAFFNVVHQQTHIRIPKWNPGIAAVLSFFIPGLGQLYKGQPFSALFWLLFVVAGYACFIIPGLILHFVCVLGATMGNPYK